MNIVWYIDLMTEYLSMNYTAKTHHTTSSFEHLQGPRKIFEKFMYFFNNFVLFFPPSLFGAKLFRVYSAKTESIRQDPSLFGCKTSLFGKNRVHSVAE